MSPLAALGYNDVKYNLQIFSRLQTNVIFLLPLLPSRVETRHDTGIMKEEGEGIGSSGKAAASNSLLLK
jgi:hypothetical protein